MNAPGCACKKDFLRKLPGESSGYSAGIKGLQWGSLTYFPGKHSYRPVERATPKARFRREFEWTKLVGPSVVWPRRGHVLGSAGLGNSEPAYGPGSYTTKILVVGLGRIKSAGRRVHLMTNPGDRPTIRSKRGPSTKSLLPGLWLTLHFPG